MLSVHLWKARCPATAWDGVRDSGQLRKDLRVHRQRLLDGATLEGQGGKCEQPWRPSPGGPCSLLQLTRGAGCLASQRHPGNGPQGPVSASAAAPQSEAAAGEVTGEHDQSKGQGSLGRLCPPTGSRPTTPWPATASSHHLPPAPGPADLLRRRGNRPRPSPQADLQTAEADFLACSQPSVRRTRRHSVQVSSPRFTFSRNLITLFGIGVIPDALG